MSLQPLDRLGLDSGQGRQAIDDGGASQRDIARDLAFGVGLISHDRGAAPAEQLRRLGLREAAGFAPC